MIDSLFTEQGMFLCLVVSLVVIVLCTLASTKLFCSYFWGGKVATVLYNLCGFVGCVAMLVGGITLLTLIFERFE